MLDLNKILLAGTHLLNKFLAVSLCLTAEKPHFMFPPHSLFQNICLLLGGKKALKASDIDGVLAAIS